RLCDLGHGRLRCVLRNPASQYACCPRLRRDDGSSQIAIDTTPTARVVQPCTPTTPRASVCVYATTYVPVVGKARSRGSTSAFGCTCVARTQRAHLMRLCK